MKTKDVLDLSPKERFLYWIKERQSVYLKRQKGLPKPWTSDEILLSYKFCNVLRINDRVSQWLLHNWYEPFKDHPNSLLACSIARQLNNPDSLAAIGYPERWQPEKVQEILESRATEGLKNYSAAYMITSNYGTRGREPETKAYQTVWTVCNPIAKSKVKIDSSSMETIWKRLLQFQGFSSFIAGQVVADLRWAVSGTWADKMDWAPMGPGSQRGLNRLVGVDKETPLNQDQFIVQLRERFDWYQRHRYMPRLEMMDFQNCLCEYDKYCRVLLGEGRPKCKYNGA